MHNHNPVEWKCSVLWIAFFCFASPRCAIVVITRKKKKPFWHFSSCPCWRSHTTTCNRQLHTVWICCFRVNFHDCAPNASSILFLSLIIITRMILPLQCSLLLFIHQRIFKSRLPAHTNTSRFIGTRSSLKNYHQSFIPFGQSFLSLFHNFLFIITKDQQYLGKVMEPHFGYDLIFTTFIWLISGVSII